MYLEKFNTRKVFFTLLILCVVVKSTWIFLHRIQPQVDYATFYYTAEGLSENFVIHNRYIALFPHIFGYSLFLSFFFKIFGSSYLIPPIVNVVLSTISMALIFMISNKIGGFKSAVIAIILWILFPSQTIYNMFSLSEPLYTTILLFIWFVMIVIHEKLPNINIIKLLLYSVLLALLLVFMNMARPIASVPIIALAIWLFIIDRKHSDYKKIFLKKSVYLVAVILSYYVLSLATNHYITARLGEKIATTQGYNFYVGFNMKSYGAWNKPDADLLFYYSDKKGSTADDVQKQMLEETKKRLQSGEINFPALFYHKFLTFLGNDGAAAGYAGSVLKHAMR